MSYRRMSMAEVRAVPWNGLIAVSSFSGCGGSSLGLRMAGFRVPYAIEFVPAAADTYVANASVSTVVDRRDIRQIKPDEILRALRIRKGELDLFEGSPPCASFSNAGMREKGWGTEKKYSDVRQQTDDLFDHYVRMVAGLMPRAFIAENVPGMEMGDAKAYMHKAGLGFRELGYRVDARVINAVGFGVPQARRRLIFIGFREDVGVELPVPVSDPAAGRFTLADALGSVDPGEFDHSQWLAESSMEGYAVGRTWHATRADAGGRKEAKARAKEVCARCHEPLGDPEKHTVGQEFVGSVKKSKETDAVPDLFADAGVPPIEKEGGRRRDFYTCADGERAVEVKDYFLLVVPDAKEPCPTLTATGAQVGAASVTHPTECRKFTPAECKAIGGFPADFVLTGTREQRYERMGRTVVPPMYAFLGKAIAEGLGVWTCPGCGGQASDGTERYDNGDACEKCVVADFAEHG